MRTAESSLVTPSHPPSCPVRPAWLDDEVFPCTSRFVDVAGHAVHYVDEGSGPPLLFLHPAPASSFMYREFIAALRSEYRCIAIDYPGFGLSTLAPGARPDLDTLSAAVARFVEALDLSDVTLLVHDTGGPIGLGAAVRDPRRYRRFVIADTMGFPINRYLPVVAMLGLVTSRPFRALNRRFNIMPRMVSTLAPVRRRLSDHERAIYRRLFPTPAARDRIIDLMRDLIEARAFLRKVEAGLRTRLSDRPALLMYGQFDPTRLMGWMGRFRRIFTTTRTRVVPREGHFPHEGSPQWMIGELRAWLRVTAGTTDVRG